MVNLLLSIAPFFIIIAIGSVLRIFIADDKWVEVLNKFGLYLGFPAIVLTSFINIGNSVPLKADIIGYNFAILISIILITFAVTKLLNLDKSVVNTYVICVFFGNVAYLGFPFTTSIIPGSEGIVCVHVAIYLILVFTLGIFILELSTGHGASGIFAVIKSITKNPLIISVFLGIFIAYFKIEIPIFIKETIQLIASAASPVVLLALGIFIAKKVEFNNELTHAACITAIKLIFLPAIFFLLFSHFSLEKEFKISVIQSAMPLAITPFALSEIYPLNKHIIAVSIFLSTIVSIITLTFLISLLNI